MPTVIQGLVGAPTVPYADGTNQGIRQGHQGDAIVSEYHGKYGEANLRGQVFHFCTLVAGVTLPIFTNTAQTFGILNPPGSNRILELIRLDLGYLSAADAPGNIVLCQPPVNTGIVATGSGGVTAATLTKGQSGQLVGGPAPISACSLLTAITTVAPTVILRTIGWSTETAVAAGTNNPLLQSIPFDGTDLLYPGSALFVACTVAAAVGVEVVNLTAMEIPWSGSGLG